MNIPDYIKGLLWVGDAHTRSVGRKNFLSNTRLDTDKSNYTFGDVVILTVRLNVKGPIRYKRVKESATYVISCFGSGLSHEVERGDVDVWLNEHKTLTMRVHHTKYSTGNNRIRLQLVGPDYECTTSASFRVE